MAYCDRCGAYIPDGLTACLACGYDPDLDNQKSRQEAAAAALREQQEQKTREEAERRRAERQAYDKTWAEHERKRREQEQEFARRQKEAEERRAREQREAEARRAREQRYGNVHVYVDADGTKRVQVGDNIHVTVNADGSKNVSLGEETPDYEQPGADYRIKFRDAGRAEETISNIGSKIMPILSYLGPLFLLPLLLGDDDFTKFHARQGLRLFIVSAILQGIGGIFGIGFAVGIFSLIMTVIGIKNVLKGKREKLPYIGNLFG